MKTMINGQPYSTDGARLIHRWRCVSLYRGMRKCGLFLHFHTGWKPERIEPISYDQAVTVLRRRGANEALAILNEEDN